MFGKGRARSGGRDRIHGWGHTAVAIEGGATECRSSESIKSQRVEAGMPMGEMSISITDATV